MNIIFGYKDDSKHGISLRNEIIEDMTPEKAREILKNYEPRWYRDVQTENNAHKAERGKEYYSVSK